MRGKFNVINYCRKRSRPTRQPFELSQKLYEVGKADFQRVLDSQKNLLSTELRHTQSKANIVRNLILLYRALGGGWDYQPDMVAPQNLEIIPLPAPLP